jgi:hypothetical protein
MDKSQHLVTVPREYIEMLEDFFEVNKDSEFNIRGVHRTHMLPPSETRWSADREEILFLGENEITDKKYDRIIVVDSVGREKFVYRLAGVIIQD